MADITASIVKKEQSPALGTKVLKVETPNTADNSDTFTITLADHGIKTLEAILGFRHDTEDSVIVAENPTTSVTSGVLTVTIPGTTANKKRVYLIYGDST